MQNFAIGLVALTGILNSLSLMELKSDLRKEKEVQSAAVCTCGPSCDCPAGSCCKKGK